MINRNYPQTQRGPYARQAYISGFLIALCLWSTLAAQPLAPQPPWPRVGPGLEYHHIRRGNQPWSVHVLKIDRSHRELTFTTQLARGHIFDLAPVSQQIRQLPENLGEPLAAVNGDFFRIRPGPYRGDPLGLHIVRGELVSSPIGTSFWLDPCGLPHIEEVTPRFRAVGPGDLNLTFTLNQQRLPDKAVLYTPTLGPSTRTSSGRELILEQVDDKPWLPLRPGGRYQARLKAIRQQGNTPLSPDIMVLSIGPGLDKNLPPIRVGDQITLSLRTHPDLTGVQTALGGGPILLRQGKPRTWKSPQPRHPRTVVAWNREFIFLFVVDGRQPGLSIGMTYPEMATMLLQLGCQEALNLDGGGSSTFWLDGRLMNSPSDGRERHVANALILTRLNEKTTSPPK